MLAAPALEPPAMLALSRMHFPVTTLGPGRRIGIWVQGCSLRCAGCISPDTWRASEARMAVEAIVHSITPWLQACDGITVSGGEPLEQPEGLHALLRAIRMVRPETNVLVYTGYAIEAQWPQLQAMAPLIDALISDPFDAAQPHTRALRGSDNQRLHCLTPRGEALFAGYERALTQEDRRFDLMLDAQGTVWLAGIPGRGDMQRLQSLLQAQGHFSMISEAPIPPCTTPR